MSALPTFVRRAILMVLLASVAGGALAQSLRDRRLGIQWTESRASLSFSARDLVDDREVRRALQSGVSKRVVLTAQVYRVGSTRPFATRTRECHITYDLWQESYVVEIGSRRRVEPDLAAAVGHCLVVRSFAVGRDADYERYRGERVYFAVRAEFNPISARRCREALRGSGGSTDPIGALVVNIVRRDICGADRAIDFRSQPVVVPGGSP